MTTQLVKPAGVNPAQGCGCAGDCGCSNPVGLERTRFFPRMLVGPDELTQDQTWIRDKLRRHNRLLHGWGVVCGCDVTQQVDAQGRPVPWVVCVDQGYVLGPYGDEILVDCPVTFDIRGTTSATGPCAPPADPWCADVMVERRPDDVHYVAIRYDEWLTRPVRTLAGCGCGCDDAECEYSRIREGYALAALDALPESYTQRQERKAGLAGLQGAITCGPSMRRAVRPCPPCPTEPWVILADVVADADGLLQIDPVRHRRYVVSFGAYAFTCGGGQIPVKLSDHPGMREELAQNMDASAMRILETEHGGDASIAPTMDAGSLKGVSKRSALGKFLGDQTIGDVAAEDRAAFVERAVAEAVPAERAGSLWETANAVVRTIESG
jgi:hypothetical protein